MGNEITPSISVTVNGVKLSQGTDYQLAYQNNVDAGEATVVVKPASGIGSEKRATFRIAPASLDRVSIGAIESQKYTGQAITPVPEVMFNGKPLVKDVDFTLAYVNNIDNGQAQVTVKGIGNFSGERTVTFNIGKSVSNATISDVSSSCTYTGSAVCPVPRVTHGDNALVSIQDKLSASFPLRRKASIVVVCRSRAFLRKRIAEVSVLPMLLLPMEIKH